MNDLEKRVIQLEKEVAELREATQPSKIAETVADELTKSIRFHAAYWPKVASPILPND